MLQIYYRIRYYKFCMNLNDLNLLHGMLVTSNFLNRDSLQILFKVLSPSYKLAHNHDLLSLLFVIVSSCHCLPKFYGGKITSHSPPQLIEKLYFSRDGRIYQNHLENYPLKFIFLAQSPPNCTYKIYLSGRYLYLNQCFLSKSFGGAILTQSRKI